jgi:hypothetical protein
VFNATFNNISVIYRGSKVYKENFIRNKSSKLVENKRSTYKKQKTPFLASWGVSCFCSYSNLRFPFRTKNIEFMKDNPRFIVFNATFNNISVIYRWSVLLVEETGVPGENHRSVANH